MRLTTFEGSFYVVSKPAFARKMLILLHFLDLYDLCSFMLIQTESTSKIAKFSAKMLIRVGQFCKRQRNSGRMPTVVFSNFAKLWTCNVSVLKGIVFTQYF